jgi:hypothetical protein
LCIHKPPKDKLSPEDQQYKGRGINVCGHKEIHGSAVVYVERQVDGEAVFERRTGPWAVLERGDIWRVIYEIRPC